MNTAPECESILASGEAVPAPSTASGSLPSVKPLPPCFSVSYVPGTYLPWQQRRCRLPERRLLVRYIDELTARFSPVNAAYPLPIGGRSLRGAEPPPGSDRFATTNRRRLIADPWPHHLSHGRGHCRRQHRIN